MKILSKHLCSLLVILLIINVVAAIFNPSELQLVNASLESNVYYTEDDTHIHIYHPTFDVSIAKLREGEMAAGRIDRLNFKGKPLVNPNKPQFGHICLLNSSDETQIRQMLPDDMFLLSATGNESNKLILTLSTSSISLFDETESLPVDVTVEFTVYADIDNIYVWVTLDSTLTTWRLESSVYGSSLGLSYFQKYQVRGTRNTVLGEDSLSGSTNNDFKFKATTAQIKVKNVTNNLAVTMFPLGLFPSDAGVGDRESSTLIYFKTTGVSTYDKSWFLYGQNIRDITYGTGIALHEADIEPQVVTPWLMPNAVPYGIMQSLDELPADTYNTIQPDPENVGGNSDAYTYWYWHEQNPEVKINLMLTLDWVIGTLSPTNEGVDKSWEVHGDSRLVNASTEWKNWLKSIEGTWIGYGIHAYHHDYPWGWEFSSVTNKTWIDATWNQITEEISDIGIKKQIWFKPAGYRLRPQALDILTKYGIQGYNVNYESRPKATARSLYVDPDGKKLILFSNSISPDDELKKGNSPSYIYNNLIKGNLTNLGLLSLSGHFINQTVYPKWDKLFDSVGADFVVQYFLVEEIIDYWYNVLLPLKYTYNSTTIEKNVNDSRLSFRLINSQIPTTSGYKYEDTTFTIYNPTNAIPEFPSWVVLSLFLIVTSSAILVKKQVFCCS